MRTVIVDDEPVARLGIRLALEDEQDVEIVAECGDGRSALRCIRDLTPDLVYLDVQMPAFDGLDVATRMLAPGAPAIIFTTAWEQYALDAFAVQAVDYLVKPWRRERFRQALERARLIVAAQRSAAPLAPPQQRFAVDSPAGIRFVNSADIEVIEAERNYVALLTAAGRHLIRGTIDSLDRRLSGCGFLRIHRSLIVNTERIVALRSLPHGEYAIVMRSRRTVRAGRSFRRPISNGSVTICRRIAAVRPIHCGSVPLSFCCCVPGSQRLLQMCQLRQRKRSSSSVTPSGSGPMATCLLARGGASEPKYWPTC